MTQGMSVTRTATNEGKNKIKQLHARIREIPQEYNERDVGT